MNCAGGQAGATIYFVIVVAPFPFFSTETKLFISAGFIGRIGRIGRIRLLRRRLARPGQRGPLIFPLFPAFPAGL
jgi:hypothetical protein